MTPYPFRIFLSYSHDDMEMVKQASDSLTRLGYTAVWDKHIRPGMRFTDTIKDLIHHAHIFMPLITESSSKRPWVHQETGYAMALNIPILPVAVDSVPGEMAAQLLAMVVKSDFSDFAEKIAEINLEQVVFAQQGQAFSNIEISDWAERRTDMLAGYARRVIEMGAYGKIRQRAALSTFSIPDKDTDNPIWARRDGNFPRSPYYHELQRAERRQFEIHARLAGCDLMVDPTFGLERNGPEATQTRLRILLQFIQEMRDDRLRILFSPRARRGNLSIVGDWFSAESVSPRPGEGHRQTVFNWHAPSVLKMIRKFDEEFEEMYTESGLEPGASRMAAILTITSILAK
jgi:hypothetical protein